MQQLVSDPKLKTVEIFTDGSCLGNPGPGGWGAILRFGGKEKELCGGAEMTTNNRMELTAAIEALSALKERCNVTLCTDSKYLIDALEKGWAAGWRAKGWMRNAKEKALNPELWEKLLQLYEYHHVSLVWIKGHNGHAENERCDFLAVQQAQQYKL